MEVIAFVENFQILSSTTHAGINGTSQNAIVHAGLMTMKTVEVNTMRPYTSLRVKYNNFIISPLKSRDRFG